MPTNHQTQTSISSESIGLKLLTTNQAAAMLVMSADELARLRMTGGGPKFIKIGRRVRYRTTDIEEWLSLRTYENTSVLGKRATPLSCQALRDGSIPHG